MANYSNNLGQIRLGWRTAVSTTPVNTNDLDATAFITAAGITDTTQISALNTLVNDLKTYGLWTKMKALYPFVGGSATSHKFNLKDPRNLDAAYRLVFNGGWTHTSNGALPNGTTGYADTFFIPSASLTNNSSHLSYYSRTNRGLRNAYTIGSCQGAPTHNNMDLRFYQNFGNKTSSAQYDGWDGLDYAGYTPTTTSCFAIASKTNVNLNKIYENGILKGTNIYTSTKSLPNVRVLIGAESSGTTGVSGYDILESAFATIGDGLSDTDASNFYISVQKFQTTLGRHVGTPYVSDTDAIAFLMAAGITDGTQASAINTLVIRMKADGVWTKMKAIYPFVGGNSTSHKFNLKDPRDLDAAFRLVFNGGWVHSSTGALPNGTTGYANTFFTPSSNFISNENAHISVYQSQPMTLSDMGGSFNSTSRTLFGANTTIIDCRLNSNETPVYVLSYNSDGKGLFMTTKNGSAQVRAYRNNTLVGTVTTQNSSNPLNMFISARNGNGTPNEYESTIQKFISFGDGLTDTEATALYNSIQSYQTTLGRQVNVPVVSDTDAQAFLNAANITSFQQASAVNKLVIDLKAAGVWSKMKAIYPFVGGSAASHKWNLKDPRDADVAYRLVFNGGWAHSSTGALPNGTTGYADTYLIPSVVISNVNSISISNYSRTQNTSFNGVQIGCYDGSNGQANELAVYQYYSIISRKGGSSYQYPIDAVLATETNTKGFQLNSRTSSSVFKLFFNNTLLNTNTTLRTANLPTRSLYIGASNWYNGVNQFTPHEHAFDSIGDGLTDTEATALYTAVQTYQTSLGRQVTTPIYNNGLVLNLDAGNANSYPGTGTTWFDLASGNNGTLVNGPTYDTTNGGSILFDGVNDRISTFPTQFPNNGSKTIDVWFKTTSTVRQGLCGTRDGSTGWVFTINRTTSGRLTYFHTGSGTAEFAAGITTNTWYNAVATHDSTTGLVKIYLNGSLIGSANVGVIYSSTFNGVIGDEDSAVPSTPFKGNIPKVTIYNKVLTDTEILNNFNSTRGRFGL